VIRLTGPAKRTAHGLTRRAFLSLGAITPIGLSLPTLLAASESAGRRAARRCLLVFLEGGPSHVDLWDMKPDAPAEVRGEFTPMRTRVPGLVVCEHMPRLAEHMHRFTLVRSVTHDINDHNAGAYFALTGKFPKESGRLIVRPAPDLFPTFGSVLAKLQPTGKALPDFVHVPELMFNNNADLPGQFSGFLGPNYDPMVTGDPSLPGWQVPGMSPRAEIPAARLDARGRLLGDVDRGLAKLGESPALGRMDALRTRAVAMLTSTEARQAFDLSQEPASVRERYGVDPGSNRALEARLFGGLPHFGQSALLARRLLEAGVRLVTLCTGRRIDQAWDTHRDHFPLLRQALLPPFDRGFSALMEDLVTRGLLEDTLVVLMGEFGRTPRLGYVTSGAGAAPNGRDHWPYCYTVLFAGAGVPEGAIVGASDRVGGQPSRDPASPYDVAATIYHLMGIPLDAEIRDHLDRPHSLIQGGGRAIPGVVGG
jgi:hypothetical protein